MIKKTAKTTFQIYQGENSKLKSTFFDLIDGNLETKQTKGLAYLFSLSPTFLKRFLKMDKIKIILKKFKGIKSDYIKVDAEMLSDGKDKIRRDITLTFYNKSLKVLILIIEAKSIKLGINHKMESQLESYIDSTRFSNEEGVQKFVIALTKYEQYFTDPAFSSIKWTELIEVLKQIVEDDIDPVNSLILRDYYKFITGVDKGMHFYEKEVLSVPAGKTFNENTKYHIHACPTAYNYRDSLFIAFRQKGGVMDKLHKVVEVFEFDPTDASMVSIVTSKTPFKERLVSYLEERESGYGFNHKGLYRFYILSEEEEILLPHEPRPEKNNTGPRYYKLAEILSGEKVIFTESKMNSIKQPTE